MSEDKMEHDICYPGLPISTFLMEFSLRKLAILYTKLYIVYIINLNLKKGKNILPLIYIIYIYVNCDVFCDLIPFAQFKKRGKHL